MRQNLFISQALFSKPLMGYRQQFHYFMQLVTQEPIEVQCTTPCLAPFLTLKPIQVSLIYH